VPARAGRPGAPTSFLGNCFLRARRVPCKLLALGGLEPWTGSVSSSRRHRTPLVPSVRQDRNARRQHQRDPVPVAIWRWPIGIERRRAADRSRGRRSEDEIIHEIARRWNQPNRGRKAGAGRSPWWSLRPGPAAVTHMHAMRPNRKLGRASDLTCVETVEAIASQLQSTAHSTVRRQSGARKAWGARKFCSSCSGF
jgi:hypothetical protein